MSRAPLEMGGDDPLFGVAEGSTVQVPAGVVTTVASTAELSKVPYVNQANLDVYSPHNLVARAANRTDPLVVAALEAFWDCTVASSLNLDPEDDDEEAWASAVLTRQHYLDIYSRISVYLLPKHVKATQAGEEEASATAELAWEQDTVGESLIFQRWQWLESLYELADTWTVGIGAREYAIFLWELIFHVHGQEATSAGYWRRAPGYWRDTNLRSLDGSVERGGIYMHRHIHDA